MKQFFFHLFIMNPNTWKLWNRSQSNTLILEWISDLVLLLTWLTHVVDGAKTNSCPSPPPPQLPGTAVSAPALRSRPRRAWALRLCCSPQQLVFCSVLTMIRRNNKHTQDHINIHTDFIRPEQHKEQWQLCEASQGLREEIPSFFCCCLPDIYLFVSQQ